MGAFLVAYFLLFMSFLHFAVPSVDANSFDLCYSLGLPVWPLVVDLRKVVGQVFAGCWICENHERRDQKEEFGPKQQQVRGADSKVGLWF